MCDIFFFKNLFLNTWKHLSPPTSIRGCLRSSTRELITRNSVWDEGRLVRSELASSYTITSFQFRFFNCSLPSFVVAKSAKLALPCCNLLRLNRSQQFTLIAPRIWLTLYAIKGRQSKSKNVFAGLPGFWILLANPSPVIVPVFLMTRERCRVEDSVQGLVGRLMVDEVGGVKNSVPGGDRVLGLLRYSGLNRLGGCRLGDIEGGDTRVDMVRDPELCPGSDMLRLNESLRDSRLFSVSLSIVVMSGTAARDRLRNSAAPELMLTSFTTVSHPLEHSGSNRESLKMEKYFFSKKW